MGPWTARWPLALSLLPLALCVACSTKASEPAPAAGASTPGSAVEQSAPAAPASAAPAPAAPTDTSSADGPDRSLLLEPSAPSFSEHAPAVFRARIQTDVAVGDGSFTIEVHRDWSPNGADRFWNLVRHGFYDDVRFFRVLAGFMAQVGICGDPKVSRVWSNNTIPDDPVVKSNTRGNVSFAKTGMPNSRSTQIFINYGSNANLDPMGFSPFGTVVAGMDVVDGLYGGYGEGAPRGNGPDQGGIQSRGNAYLDQSFPKLSRILNARIVGE